LGVYDYIRCEQPLPDGWRPAERMQTKDFDCELVEYIITKDGRLLRDYGHLEHVPAEERPGADPDHVLQAVGGFRRVRRIMDTDFGGVVRFGGLEVIGYEPDQSHGGRATYWSNGKLILTTRKPIYESHNYRAKFDDGQLVEFVMDEN
jgi:hypothetical protein